MNGYVVTEQNRQFLEMKFVFPYSRHSLRTRSYVRNYRRVLIILDWVKDRVKPSRVVRHSMRGHNQFGVAGLNRADPLFGYYNNVLDPMWFRS